MHDNMLPNDDELAALALAADPHALADPDAIPIAVYLGTNQANLLPDWYMPVASSTSRSPLRSAVVVTIIASFVLIDGLGLCNTFGFLTWA